METSVGNIMLYGRGKMCISYLSVLTRCWFRLYSRGHYLSSSSSLLGMGRAGLGSQRKPSVLLSDIWAAYTEIVLA